MRLNIWYDNKKCIFYIEIDGASPPKNKKLMMEKDDRIFEIVVDGAPRKVTFKTIKRNFDSSESYNKIANYLDKNRKGIGYETLEEYIVLLKLGKIRTFNLSLGAKVPVLTLEDSGSLSIVKAYLKRNNIKLSIGGTSVVFNKHMHRFEEVVDYCTTNGIKSKISFVEL